MRILFLHDNFPAQFGRFGQYLAREGWEVWYGTQRKNAALPGLNVFNYAPHRSVTENIHPYTAPFERAVINGQGLVRAGQALKAKGFEPDIVMAHSGWGPGLFVKDLWPQAKYVGYFEWYYRADAPDVAFLTDGKPPLDDQLRARARNASILTDLASCDAAICPTAFQKDQFPEVFHSKIMVMHDGIDDALYAPKVGAGLNLPNLKLSAADTNELITYVARGMEPYRGFPTFMEALEIILKERSNARAVIVGEDRVAYGRQLPEGDSYKARALKECDLDWDRVHFTGLLLPAQYLKVLQASKVHIYLTVPFVLSWSMLEAMSAGCAIVASNVAPVREVADKAPDLMQLTELSPQATAEAVLSLLDAPSRRVKLGENARELIQINYSKEKIYSEKKDFLTRLISKDKTP